MHSFGAAVALLGSVMNDFKGMAVYQNVVQPTKLKSSV